MSLTQQFEIVRSLNGKNDDPIGVVGQDAAALLTDHLETSAGLTRTKQFSPAQGEYAVYPKDENGVVTARSHQNGEWWTIRPVLENAHS